MSGTGRRRGQPAAEHGPPAAEPDQPEAGAAPTPGGPPAPAGQPDAGAEEFAFAEEAEAEDVIDWLAFTETRSERREERRRQSRFRLIAGGTVLGLLIAAVGGYFAWNTFGRDHTGGLGGPRLTVLFQLHGLKGEAAASAVIVHEQKARRGSVLVVPPGLTLQSPGQPSAPVRSALSAFGPSLSRDALADELGVQLDGSWVLEEVAFASLVDQLGGIQAPVDVDVRAGKRVVVRAGTRHLDGAGALAYATYRAPNEPEQSQLARFQRVLAGLFAVLPTRVNLATNMLDNIGVIPEPTMTNQRLAAALSGLALDAGAKRIQYGILPVRSNGVLDANSAGGVVHGLLGGSVRQVGADGGTPRVLVVDATAHAGPNSASAQAVEAKLIGAGYRYLDGGPGDEHRRLTLVEVSDGSATGRRNAEQVALTLGVGTSAVTVVKGDIAADVVVILGDDFLP